MCEKIVRNLSVSREKLKRQLELVYCFDDVLVIRLGIGAKVMTRHRGQTICFCNYFG